MKKYKNFALLGFIFVSSFLGAGYSLSQKEKVELAGFTDIFNKQKDDQKIEIKKENSDNNQKDIEKITEIKNFEKSGFSDLTEKLMPSVVSVITVKKIDQKNQVTGMMVDKDLKDFLDRFFSSPFGAPFNDGRGGEHEEKPLNPQVNKEMTFGSGFVISADGYIVTNNHVIENADEISIKFSDDKQLKAKLIGSDELIDLALLKVTPKNSLDFVSFGDSDLVKIGQWAIAIGNPFGLGGSVSIGVVSAIARDINAGPYDNFIQTDAAINRGHSGGPLFNAIGDVVGINTAIISPSGGNVGIGFAIPSNLAVPILNNLKEGKKTKRGYLGVKVQALNQEMADALGLNEPYGALVAEIMKDSPAEQAGLQVGDLILEFNDVKIKSMRQLPRLVAVTPIDSIATMKLISKSQEKIIKIKILESKELSNSKDIKNPNRKKEVENQKFESKEFKDWGISITDLTDEIKYQFKIDKNVSSGVIITDVRNDSPAANVGLMKRDVILQLNQEDVKSIHEFETKIRRKKTILLLVNRNGAIMFVSPTLEK
jgi:serine protease Do